MSRELGWIPSFLQNFVILVGEVMKAASLDTGLTKLQRTWIFGPEKKHYNFSTLFHLPPDLDFPTH